MATQIDQQTKFIIDEVEQRPVLWDKKHKCYHYREIVDSNWQSIAQKTSIPKLLLKRKWKGIRDQFRVELKKIPNAGECEITDTDIEKYTVWPHFKSLLFLKDQMKLGARSAATISNTGMEYLPASNYDSSIEDDSINDPLTPGGFTIEEVNMEKHNAKKCRTPTTDCTSEMMAEKPTKSRNDDTAFFVSLMPYFEQMDMQRKMLCRMEIQKIVYNYAFPPTVQNEACVGQSNNSPVSQKCQDIKPFQIDEFIM